MATVSQIIACGDDERARIAALLEEHPDWPMPGIRFLDIFPIFRSAANVRSVIQILARHTRTVLPGIEVILGMEARGFLFGSLLAAELNIGFCPVRKAGKLPGAVKSRSYDLEYGSATIEMQSNHGFRDGAHALLVDDLIATGGTYIEWGRF